LTSDNAADYNASHTITNGYEPWKGLVSVVFKHDKFDSIIREEWSRDRAFKYLRAASPIEALRRHITNINTSFYLVTGILLGVTAGTKSSKASFCALRQAKVQERIHHPEMQEI